MRFRHLAAVLAACLLGASPALAIMSGAESKLAPSSDADYAAGKAAFEAGDWQGAIANLTMVLLRRPWHDNANTMIAYSWRRLGDYEQAFAYYDAALRQNPHHRGAMEYLAEAYLDVGRTEDANVMLRRLAVTCDEVVMAFDNTGWKSGCEELSTLIDAYLQHGVPLPLEAPAEGQAEARERAGAQDR